MKSLGASIVLLSSIALSFSQETYDYVIVGGGTAGLTLATRLTEDPEISVHVLEAGGTGLGNSNITDIRNRLLVFDTELDWAIPTMPQTAANGRVYVHRQGKVLGGSSAINGVVYIRPDAREFAALEKLGAKGWTWENLLHYFKKSERFTANPDDITEEGDATFHGVDGPIHVTYGHKVSSFFDEYVYPTVLNMGEIVDTDNNDGTPLGLAPEAISSYPGTYNRSYAANSYYWPNQHRSNLHVLTDSWVSRILWGSDEDGLAVATDVEYLTSDGTSVTVNASNVILSAGSLHTPKVLELSGVGDPEILSALNISVKVVSPGVGNNLQNQLGIEIRYQLKNGSVTMGEESQSPAISLWSAQTVLSEEDLVLSADMLRTKPDDISQAQFDLMKQLIADGIAQTEMNWRLRDGPDGSFILEFYTTDLHTFSRGYVHTNSSDPTVPVTIDPKYFTSAHDLWYLSRAVAYTRNITAAEPLASIIEFELVPGANYSTAEDIQEWLLPNFRTMSHFVGTSAALPQSEQGVVDPESFIVYGTKNVRVADCSIIPLLPGIHSESIAYAIGEWAADIVKEAKFQENEFGTS